VKSVLKFAAILLAIVAVLYGLDRLFQTSAALRQQKLEYAEYRRTVESANAMSLERITSLERASAEYVDTISTYQSEILARDATIATLRGEISVSNAEISTLRTEVQPVLDANPQVAELVASLDAGILLRDMLIVEQQGQITTLTAQGIVKDQRFTVQVAITDEWKTNFDREHRLRLMADELNLALSRQGKVNGILAKLSTAGLVGVGALVLLNAITH
jgi:chromosome segregation ATPase